jgi:hypothetical protein
VVFRGEIILAERGLEQDERGDAAGHVGDFAGLVRRERPAKQGVLAVAQPFFHHLVATDSAIPDFFRHVAPTGGVVREDVMGGLAE